MLMSYLALKYLHILAAVLTISGFILRGVWMMTDSPKLELPITRISPHIVDTVFLLSGLAMVAMLSLNPLAHAWLIAKFAGIIAYIVLGTIAIRRGRTRDQRLIAFAAALSVFAYIVGAALTKSPASWLAWFA